MDGNPYVDHKTPFIVATQPLVTLTSVYQNLLVPPQQAPIMGSNYFNYVGKAVRVRTHGMATSGATPGNFTVALLYGDGQPNGGVQLGGLQAGWTASLVNQDFILEALVRCVGLAAGGTQGSLFMTGKFLFQGWGQGAVSPFTQTAQTCDLTLPYYINFQMKRSGSTSETAQIHEIMFEALN